MAVSDLLKKKKINQRRCKVLTIMVVLLLYQVSAWFLSERDRGIASREMGIVFPGPSLPQPFRNNSHGRTVNKVKLT